MDTEIKEPIEQSDFKIYTNKEFEIDEHFASQNALYEYGRCYLRTRIFRNCTFKIADYEIKLICSNCKFYGCTFIFYNSSKGYRIDFNQCLLKDIKFISNNKAERISSEFRCMDSLLTNIVFENLNAWISYTRIGQIKCLSIFDKRQYENVIDNMKVIGGNVRFCFTEFPDSFIKFIEDDPKRSADYLLTLTDKEKKIFSLTKWINNIDFTETDVKAINGALVTYRALYDYSIAAYNTESLLKNIKFSPEKYQMHCPESGSFIAYKAYTYKLLPDHKMGYVIAKIRIPEDAKRSSGFDKKCRADKVIIEALYNVENLNQQIPYHDAKHMNLYSILYNDPGLMPGMRVHNQDNPIGALIKDSNPFDDCRWNECSKGIHFFMSKKECRDFLIEIGGISIRNDGRFLYCFPQQMY